MPNVLKDYYKNYKEGQIGKTALIISPFDKVDEKLTAKKARLMSLLDVAAWRTQNPLLHLKFPDTRVSDFFEYDGKNYYLRDMIQTKELR